MSTLDAGADTSSKPSDRPPILSSKALTTAPSRTTEKTKELTVKTTKKPSKAKSKKAKEKIRKICCKLKQDCCDKSFFEKQPSPPPSQSPTPSPTQSTLQSPSQPPSQSPKPKQPTQPSILLTQVLSTTATPATAFTSTSFRN